MNSAGKPKLEIIPFEPEHLRLMQPRAFEAREMRLLGGGEERARIYAGLGPAYTGILTGDEDSQLTILACGGLIMHWRGVAEAWLVTTDQVAMHPVVFHRTIIRIFKVLMESMGLWRVQIAIKAGHRVSCKWVLRLGFREEGPAPRYGPDGSDYLRFAWVRQEEE